VLIGRENYKDPQAKKRFEDLIARPNVHWLPYRQPATLPGYLKALDVCLMCYVVNGWTYFGDPSKMHEYLASGKPTIGAPLPAIKEFSDVVRVPETNEGWIEAIEQSLAETSEQMVAERIRVARMNSYPERIRRAVEIIEESLGRKLQTNIPGQLPR
jgi:glycosyltransferase involved in cell wall biosynthesis